MEMLRLLNVAVVISGLIVHGAFPMRTAGETLGVDERPAMRAISIHHPHDTLIHGWHADVLAGRALDRTGTTDVSDLLNTALERLFARGGGTLYLPAGKYRLDQPVFIRPGTALRGDYVEPSISEPVDPTKNTIIRAYYGRGMDDQAEPLFIQDGSSLIDGLVIWYPEQQVDAIVPYAPTIRQMEVDSQWAINSATRNVFLVNAYTGIQLGDANSGTCIELMKNIYGTPLRRGIEVWRDADIPRIVGVGFNPDYWPASGLDEKPVDRAALKKHLFENASGITYHRCDGSELANITIRGYRKGLELADGHIHGKYKVWLDSEGHYVNFRITECYDAVWIKNIKNHGTQFYNCVLEGKRAAVFVENPMRGLECAMFMGCTLRGGEAALMQSWEAKPNDKFSLMFSACRFESPMVWTGGNLIVTDCDFSFEENHLFVGADAASAIITDCRFSGGRQIENRAGDRFKLSASRKQYIKVPPYTYDENKISTYAPTRQDTIWVEAGNGKSDDSPRIQKMIDAVSLKGGGYVVLNPGLYMLKKQLTVRKNVELRGPVQSWQHSKFLSHYVAKGTPKGAVIFVEYGKNDENNAAVILEENAGLDGLFFHYPDQQYSPEKQEILETYAWLIRMKGDRAYVKHVTASNPWRFIDLHTHDAKDCYIGYCNGAPLDIGIFVGEAENCAIDNVHFNSWYWNTVSFPNAPTKGKNGYKPYLDNWMKANTKAFVFAGSRNVDVYGSFIFCSNQAFKLLPGKRSGKGPSGIVINSGCDWSKYGLYMHANDGLVFANMHFIDVAHYDDDREISSIYIAENCDDIVSLYNVSTWGNSPRTIYVRGNTKAQVNICNFSYQLYPDQENIIESGKVVVVNAIRNVPETSIGFDLGSTSRLMIRASIFPEKLKISPARIKVDLEAAGESFFEASRHPGVRRSYSFP